MKRLRLIATLAWPLLALPVTCSQAGGPGSDLYRGGLTPSGPGANINPGDPLLVNGGNGGAGGVR